MYADCGEKRTVRIGYFNRFITRFDVVADNNYLIDAGLLCANQRFLSEFQVWNYSNSNYLLLLQVGHEGFEPACNQLPFLPRIRRRGYCPNIIN